MSDEIPTEFAHLDQHSEPQTAAEAFWMAQQWGARWSNWNVVSNGFTSDEMGAAMAATGAADNAHVQRLVAIGVGFTVKEQLGAALADLVNSLGGIEDRLSEINAAVRN